MITRRFGNERTNLSLSDEAYRIYINSDPCEIYEHEDEDGNCTYSVEGILSRSNMSEEDVNSLLLSLAEEDEDEE